VEAVDGLNLVGLQPVEELLLVEGAVVHVGRHSDGLKGKRICLFAEINKHFDRIEYMK
jgi:hypothetical protein